MFVKKTAEQDSSATFLSKFWKIHRTAHQSFLNICCVEDRHRFLSKFGKLPGQLDSGFSDTLISNGKTLQLPFWNFEKYQDSSPMFFLEICCKTIQLCHVFVHHFETAHPCFFEKLIQNRTALVNVFVKNSAKQDRSATFFIKVWKMPEHLISTFMKFATEQDSSWYH